jgi:hypothetical protein
MVMYLTDGDWLEHITTPENARIVFDAYESVTPALMDTLGAVAGAATGLALSPTGPLAVVAEAGLEAAGGLAAAAFAKAILNDDSTVGFKQCILREDDENKPAQIILNSDGTVTWRFNSGSCDTDTRTEQSTRHARRRRRRCRPRPPPRPPGRPPERDGVAARAAGRRPRSSAAAVPKSRAAALAAIEGGRGRAQLEAAAHWRGAAQRRPSHGAHCHCLRPPAGSTRTQHSTAARPAARVRSNRQPLWVRFVGAGAARFSCARRARAACARILGFASWGRAGSNHRPHCRTLADSANCCNDGPRPVGRRHRRGALRHRHRLLGRRLSQGETRAAFCFACVRSGMVKRSRAATGGACPPSGPATPPPPPAVPPRSTPPPTRRSWTESSPKSTPRPP